jgi:hypothetical protein
MTRQIDAVIHRFMEISAMVRGPNFCPSCGFQVQDHHSKTCASCGARFHGINWRAIWDSHVCHALRWMAFIPLTYVCLGLIEYGVYYSIFIMVTSFVWYWGLLFWAIGPGPFVVGFAFGFWTLVVLIAFGVICPKPKVGSIVFTTLYVFLQVLLALHLFSLDWSATNLVSAVFVKVGFAALMVFGAKEIYTGEWKL